MLAPSIANRERTEVERFVPPCSPVRVAAPDELLLEMSRHAAAGFNKVRHGGVEVGGVLYGSIDNGVVRCERFEMLEIEHAYGPRFRLSPGDHARLGAMLMDERGTAVGWWVAHGRTGLALTDHDREVFDSHFPDPRQIAIVLKPAFLEPSKAVIFVRSGSGFECGSEFEIVPEPTPEARAEIDVQQPATAAQSAEQKRPERRQAWLLAAVAAGVLLLTGGVFAWRMLTPPAPVEERIIQVIPRSPAEEADRERLAQLEAEIARLKAQVGSRAEASPGTVVKKTGRVASGAQDDEAVLTAARTFSAPARPQPLIEPVELGPAPELPVLPKPQPVNRPASEGGKTVFLPLAEAPADTSGVPGAAASGRVLWTGLLKNGLVLSIDGQRISAGRLHAALPGGPVRVSVHGGELTTDGIVLYTSDSSKNGRVEPPGPQNGWNRTVYRFDPQRASQLAILETPQEQNGWKKLVVRSSGRPLSVLAVDWRGSR